MIWLEVKIRIWSFRLGFEVRVKKQYWDSYSYLSWKNTKTLPLIFATSSVSGPKRRKIISFKYYHQFHNQKEAPEAELEPHDKQDTTNRVRFAWLINRNTFVWCIKWDSFDWFCYLYEYVQSFSTSIVSFSLFTSVSFKMFFFILNNPYYKTGISHFSRIFILPFVVGGALCPVSPYSKTSQTPDPNG